MSKDKQPIADALLDQLLANYQKPEDLIGADGLRKPKALSSENIILT